MDDDFNQKADDFAENAEDAASSTWEHVEETGQDIVDAVENKAENVWETVEDKREEAADFVNEGAETVQGTWSEIKEEKMDQNDEFMQASAESWSAETQPAPEAYPQGETNRWGSPVPPQEPYHAPEPPQSVPREEYRSVNTGQVVTPQEKKEFPIWAIVLIIVLVLCLCFVIPVILILGGGIAIFRNIIEHSSLLLPYLFM